MSLTLSVLDQSPIAEGSSPEDALKETIELAQRVEALGYHRFWVSEHHDTNSLAGSSPEILVAYLAAKTTSIRLGSGGVMLPHYSAYKVAENFKVLEALAPNRIDLGIGRAPGGMPRATIALHDGKTRDIKRYPKQVEELLQYLYDSIPENDPLYGLKATPLITTTPDVWLLGSSESTASLAASKGLPYSFAQFINGENGPNYMQLYRDNFTPSQYLTKPKSMISVFVICATTDKKAEEIASSLDLALVMLEQGMPMNGFPNPTKASQYPFASFEKKRVLENRKRLVVGSPAKVKDTLLQLSEVYAVDEIMVVTTTFDYQDKLSSFELLAKTML
ncbi:LLM class flavin-dependent oxidoreductase [Bacillus sp. HMF5848]|uniref:LLM class flavin-dependent oxidoreductase n=1 Tax=Bacillus sp. HMF5848 TaxID=2495421 RepID=UPI000F7A51D1|nr:LLM class flavin-dependent oxidoreductase [Bacillus sp. HMF5848]RSK26771.1 LLM class flavin-dependent oxidoreductase [Bacillus sp. HMF5848]